MVKQIFTHKIFLLLLLSLLLMVPVQSIMELNRERQAYRSQAIHSIMASSSGPQRLMGPIIVQPYTRSLTVEQEGKRFVRQEQIYRYLLPEQLDIRANMEVTPRKLGIYQAQVYQTRLTLSGHLPTRQSLLNDATSPLGETAELVAGKPYLSLVLSDARGINSVPELQLGTQRIPFAPGARLGDALAGIHAPLDSLPQQDGTFHLELNLQGMNALDIVPLGKESTLQLAGNWP
ncbi:TPA: inner membrane CreD family protein, partial [Aeromonas veronii]